MQAQRPTTRPRGQLKTVATLLMATALAACLTTRGVDRPVGGDAPAFALTAHTGEIVRLEDYAGKASVVVVFYRGHW